MTITCACGASYPAEYPECPNCGRPTDRQAVLDMLTRLGEDLGLYGSACGRG